MEAENGIKYSPIINKQWTKLICIYLIYFCMKITLKVIQTVLFTGHINKYNLLNLEYLIYVLTTDNLTDSEKQALPIYQ